MSVFEAYYRNEIRRDHERDKARFGGPEAEVLDEDAKTNAKLKDLKRRRAQTKAMGGSSAYIDGLISNLEAQLKGGKKKAKKKPLKEDGELPPMPAAPAPAPGGGGGGNDQAAKAFIKIAVDAANFLADKENEFSGMPSDSPELSQVRSAEGLLKEYQVEQGDDNKIVSSKVSLLAKELRDLFNDGGSGEIATYLQALADKLDEFRATIDVSDAGGDMMDEPPAEEPAPEEPAAAPAGKDAAPPSREQQHQDLAQGLELNIK